VLSDECRGGPIARRFRPRSPGGAKPAYAKCLFDGFAGLAKATVAEPDEILDVLPALIGRKPKTLAEFARIHADEFRY
jgi:hypothetical protein